MRHHTLCCCSVVGVAVVGADLHVAAAMAQGGAVRRRPTDVVNFAFFRSALRAHARGPTEAPAGSESERASERESTLNLLREEWKSVVERERVRARRSVWTLPGANREREGARSSTQHSL